MTRLIDGNKLILWLNDSWYASFKYEESPTSIAIKEVIKAVEEYINNAPTIEPSGDLISRADALAFPIRLDHYDEEHGDRKFVLGIESVMEYIEHLPSVSAEPNILNDGTLVVNVSNAKSVSRVLVSDTDKNVHIGGGLFYPEAEDAEPKRGKWQKENIVLTSNPPQYRWNCSECGMICETYGTPPTWGYCPNCGAYMGVSE